jgi:SAM-dependent methyltransferase
LNEDEISWYKNYAHKAGGPILELACGTGRLLIKLAEAGFDVTGIDLSDKMLEVAGHNTSKLPAGIKNKIKLLKVDITGFNFDRQFGLIFMADNSFRELRTREDQTACLRTVHKHLSPKGAFLLTVRRFDLSGFTDGKKGTPWSKPIIDPASGHTVSRKVEFTLADDKKRVNGIYRYRIIDLQGTTRFEECPFVSPVLQEEDYFALLTKAGFKPELFYDFSDQKNNQGQTLCFVCCK